MKLILYVDMDGVLCDFNKAVENITGKQFSHGDIGEGRLHKIIDNAGVEFWSEMPPMPFGLQLWNHLKGHNPILLSSPGSYKYSREGKRLWKEKYLGDPPMILDNDKGKYARKNTLLIDDWDKNIKEFTAAGGKTIEYLDYYTTVKMLYRKINGL